MGYQTSIERDLPVVFNTFDNASNKTHPLVAGLGSAALVTTAAFTHTFDQWTQVPFTVEIWFKPLSSNKVTILGHDDDGLTYDPATNLISWTIKQSDGSFITTSQQASTKTMYLVGQYNGYSITLYVDGKSSSEFTYLPIMATGSLRTGAGKMSVDALAMYDYVLDDSKMEDHYFEGIDFPQLEAVYARSENYFDLEDTSESILTSIDFSEWNNGYFDGTIVNQLGNLTNDIGVSAGIAYFNVIVPDDVPLQGSKLSYRYTGTEPKVEVTVNEVNWNIAKNHNALPGVPAGAVMGGYDPLIRVTLAEDTQLESFQVVIYRDTQSVGVKDTNYLKITRPAVSSDEQMIPFQQDSVGGSFINGGSLVLNKKTDDTIAAISFWYKGDEPTGGTKNGGSGHVADQWNFYYSNSSTFNLNNYNGQVANVVTWSETQTPSVLYANHFSKPTILVVDSDKITVTEPAGGVKVSQKNWIML
jgi:hypothetical protein